MAVEHRPVDRRKFLRASASAAGAALSLPASSYARVSGSNKILRIGFIGCGGRAQAHLHLVVKMAMENKGVAPVAVCDVWDGLDEEYDHTFGTTTTRRRYCQGLYPAALKCGLNPDDRQRVTKDYRRLLDFKEIDAVCIATPDHWHARQTLDAFAAGKDVLVETPLTRTADEARAVLEAANAGQRVLALGVQGLANPVWRQAYEVIRAGRIGPLSHVSAGVFRNDIRGQWRFHRVVPQMTGKSIDWDLFLGHRFEVNGVPVGPNPAQQPFDATAFAQWKCLRAFSHGIAGDLLTHPVAKLLAATGCRHPRRVIGSSGLYVETDGRTVPDAVSLIAEFDDCHWVVSGATSSAYPMEDLIRGRQGTIMFVAEGFQIIADDPHGGGRLPTRLETAISPQEIMACKPPKNETEAMWQNFLECVRTRNRQTFAPVELAATAATITAAA